MHEWTIQDSAAAPLISISRSFEAPERLVIGDGLVTIDLKTGKHTLAEGVDINEAARTFWEAVSQMLAPARHTPTGKRR